jgi:biopolymer transport protein ExbD
MPKVNKEAGKGAGAVTFNMTPMIDIVFNLIIFFILTSQFVQMEIEVVTLPISRTSMPKDVTDFRNVVINIKNPDNPQVIVSGQVLDHHVREGPNELTEFLKSRKGESDDDRPMNVILRADADICYEEVARVMLAAGAAKIEGWWITTEIEKQEEAR